MNRRLFFRIYNFTLNNETARKTAVFVSRLSKTVFMAFYGLGFIILLLSSDIFAMPRYVFVPFAVLVINTTLRRVLNKPRPFVQEDIEALVPHEESGSMPSNHSASAMIIAFSWLCISPPVAAALMVLALMTGTSRVMTGIHYPLDIACGWIIAIIGGIIGFVI